MITSMKMIRLTTLNISIILIALMIGCSSDSNYDSLVKSGLSSGVTNDSLFLGYRFGMSSEEFQRISWDMNQQGIISGYTKINYTFDELKSKASMEFFPVFKNNEIIGIPVTITYDGWSPWLEELDPQYLILDLIEYYQEIYDTEFIEVFVPSINQNASVSIDGNREIRLYQNSPNSVMIDFIDLSKI